jgi:hypothetical protein
MNFQHRRAAVSVARSGILLANFPSGWNSASVNYLSGLLLAGALEVFDAVLANSRVEDYSELYWMDSHL